MTRGLRTTSPDASDSRVSAAEPLRSSFAFELEQLKLQVEMMSMSVHHALTRSVDVLLEGDLVLADEVVAGDDAIDDMLVSLTERCYDLLCRQTPVASDLRLVVSVLRIVGDLERTGDLCLRIVKLAPDHHLLVADGETFGILREMAHEAVALFELGAQAWAARDLRLAKTLEQRDDTMDARNARLLEAIMRMDGPFGVPQAVTTLLAGRALERIADHSVMMGERLRYMLTGDVRSLSKEIGP